MLNRYVYDTSSLQDRLLQLQLHVHGPSSHTASAGPVTGVAQQNITADQSRL